MSLNNLKHLSLVVSIAASFSQVATAETMPSFTCNFTEPFINIDTARNAIYYSDNDQNQGLVARPLTRKIGANYVVSGVLKDGQSFNVKISKGRGSNGMSDVESHYIGVMSGVYSVNGGCDKIDAPIFRKVVGVAQNDTLNMRDAPNVTGKILEKIYPVQTVWLKTEPPKTGWVKVIVVASPKSGQGLTLIKEGWVNGKFLGKIKN